MALAVAALPLVLGFRVARPERAREWVAFAAEVEVVPCLDGETTFVVARKR